jgi:hypothetical protein
MAHRATAKQRGDAGMMILAKKARFDFAGGPV